MLATLSLAARLARQQPPLRSRSRAPSRRYRYGLRLNPRCGEGALMLQTPLAPAGAARALTSRGWDPNPR